MNQCQDFLQSVILLAWGGGGGGLCGIQALANTGWLEMFGIITKLSHERHSWWSDNNMQLPIVLWEELSEGYYRYGRTSVRGGIVEPLIKPPPPPSLLPPTPL